MKHGLKVGVATVMISLGTCGFVSCANVAKYEKFLNPELYTVGSVSFTLTQVKEIDLDWLGGSIDVVHSPTEEVLVEEETQSENEEERMRYYLNGNVLKIKYCQSGYRGRINEQNKNLRIAIPDGVSLDIDCTSAAITVSETISPFHFSVESTTGNVDVERLCCEEAELETQSGKISVGEVKAKRISVDTKSGDCTIARLAANHLEAETGSGNFSFALQAQINAEVESSGGDITVILNEGLGAQVEFETASGKFHCEKSYGKTTGGRYDVYGAEGNTELCRLELDTFNGDVYIK